MDPIRASDGETRDLYVDPYARPCRAQEDPSVLSGRALCCPRARAPFGDTADGDGHRAAGRRAGVPAESGAPEDVSEPGLRQPPLPGPPSSPGRGGVGWGWGGGVRLGRWGWEPGPGERARAPVCVCVCVCVCGCVCVYVCVGVWVGGWVGGAGRGGAGTGLGVGGARGEGTVPVPLRSEGRFCPAENSLPSGARGEQVSLQSI